MYYGMCTYSSPHLRYFFFLLRKNFTPKIYHYFLTTNYKNGEEQVDNYDEFEINNELDFDIEEEIRKIMTLSPMSTPTSTFSPTDSISTVATEPETKANLDTISYVKSLMIDSSKLLGLYSTLKNTYLKLCKEYNYLLTKFNDNEKAKLQLIQENEELKQAMAELLQDRSSKKRRKSRKALA